MKKCIMAFGAHADDIEIRCGGALAKFKDKGYKLIYVLVAACDAGSPPGSNETGQMRKEEAAEGAKVLGAESVFLGFKESFVCNEKEKLVRFGENLELFEKWKKLPGKEFLYDAPFIPRCVIEVADLIAKYEPEIVFTHYPDDMNVGHYSTSCLVFKAFKEASEKVKLGDLYLWPSGSRGSLVDFSPNTFIDITKYMEKKGEAVNKHKSQAWRWQKTSYWKKRDVTWGKKIKVKYAEGFYKVRAPLTRNKYFYLTTYDRRMLEYKKGISDECRKI
ncbi:MAG: PIG-L deacetylase family protein [bacterium]